MAKNRKKKDRVSKTKDSFFENSIFDQQGLYAYPLPSHLHLMQTPGNFLQENKDDLFGST